MCKWNTVRKTRKEKFANCLFHREACLWCCGKFSTTSFLLSLQHQFAKSYLGSDLLRGYADAARLCKIYKRQNFLSNISKEEMIFYLQRKPAFTDTCSKSTLIKMPMSINKSFSKIIVSALSLYVRASLP